MSKKKTYGFFPLFMAVCSSYSLSAPLSPSDNQSGTPSVQARRLSEKQSKKMQIDGLLAESAWSAAVVASGFRQREPDEGSEATEKTEVKVLYDSHTLYFGVTAFDSQSDKIISRILQRDKIMVKAFDGKPAFAGDDAVAILLDPFHDQRNAVVFATNPNGAEFEALITDEGREFNVDWRAVWKVASKRIPGGWSAEFAIPFRSLRYPSNADDQPWGFNVYRIIRRKNEEVLWSAWSRNNEGFARVSRAAHLYGMTDLPRYSFNLEVKPSALSSLTRELQTSEVDSSQFLDTDPDMDVGFDAKWEVRPGLLLDLTLNTDFAQVEADDEQVNLTRFSLFFPEKRDFFLENSGIFEFGSRGFFEPPPFLLFFSRRIGISGDNLIPVIGGARLTGRIGGQTVGLLNVVTDKAFDEPRTNYAVARVKRDVGSSNYFGAMFTDKRSEESWNSGAGIDWSFWPGRRLNMQGFVARTFTPDNSGNAYRLAIDYTSDEFGLFAQHLMIEEDATAEMGFITRSDIRRTGGFTRFTLRPKKLGLRLINFFWATEYFTRLDGETLDWSNGPGIGFEWDSGESFTIFFLDSFTALSDTFKFESIDTVFVPPEKYDNWQLSWFANTSGNRPVVLGTQGSYQGFFGGNLFAVGGALNVSFGSNVSFRLNYTHNHVEVPQGTFNADIASVRLSYAFSTRLFLNALLQYNSLDNEISANVRLNFIHTPGSDLFIVLNEQRGDKDTSVWDLRNRSMVAKLTYLKRF